MATLNISLPESLKAWVKKRGSGNNYTSASDYVCHLIRLDYERTEAISEIQAELTKGIESGELKPFDKDAFVARFDREQDGA
jgi:antitoxin ParD1/3/4